MLSDKEVSEYLCIFLYMYLCISVSLYLCIFLHIWVSLTHATSTPRCTWQRLLCYPRVGGPAVGTFLLVACLFLPLLQHALCMPRRSLRAACSLLGEGGSGAAFNGPKEQWTQIALGPHSALANSVEALSSSLSLPLSPCLVDPAKKLTFHCHAQLLN